MAGVQVVILNVVGGNHVTNLADMLLRILTMKRLL